MTVDVAPPSDEELSKLHGTPAPSNVTLPVSIKGKVPPPKPGGPPIAVGSDRFATKPIMNPASLAGKAMASSLAKEVDSLGADLIALGILSAEEWSAALAAAPSRDVDTILNILRETPARRPAIGTETTPTILTEYQLERVRAGKGSSLRLHHYLLLAKLGEGGMGEVYVALNLNLNKCVAIKTIHPGLASGTLGGLSEGRDRFNREARVLAQLDHRYITAVYDANQDNGTAYIVMEYVRGKNLKTIVEGTRRKGEFVPVWWVVERALAVAEALGHAHQHGIVHRDVKPSNIMITEANELKVLDMGIARLLDRGDQTGGAGGVPRLTRDQAPLGTPDVMPPEQWADARDVSPASDIYSLGCTLYYSFVGEMPFRAPSVHPLMLKHLTEPLPSVVAVRPEAPKVLDTVLAKMTAKERASRYQSCDELIQDLSHVLDVIQEEAPDDPGRPWYLQPRTLVATASVAALVLILWGVVSFLSRGKGEVASNGGQQVAGQQVAAITSVPEPSAKWATAVNDLRRSFQQENAAIWPSEGRLDQYIKELNLPVASQRDLETLKQRIEAETRDRRQIQEDWKKFLATHYAENEGTWASLSALEEEAKARVNVGGLVRQSDLANARIAITALTAERWRKQVNDQLEEVQRAFSDVWPKREDMMQQARELASLETIRRPAEIKSLTDRLTAEGWKRRFEAWLPTHQAEHTVAWESLESLRTFADQQGGSAIKDKNSFEAVQKLIEAESSTRIGKQADKWLTEQQATAPEVWTVPVMQRIAEAKEKATSDAGYKQFQEMTFAAVAGNLSPSVPQENTAAAYAARLVSATYRQLLQHFPAFHQQPASVALRLKVVENNRLVEVNELKPNQGFTLEVTSPKSGFVTLLILEATGAQYLFHWDQPLEADRATPLVFLEASTPGIDHYFVLITNEQLKESQPRPVDVYYKETPQPPYWPKLTALPMKSPEGVDNVAAVYGDRRIFDRILENLKAGTRPAWLGPATNTTGTIAVHRTVKTVAAPDQ